MSTKMLASYKNEIVEAEKSRMDLLRWKLIIVAVLASVSLDMGYVFASKGEGSSNNFIHYVVCLIPLVCAYVDLLCVHLQIRILVISKFFKDLTTKESADTNDDITIFKKYEAFCDAKRKVFNFQDWAQTTSTIVLCLLVIGFGIFCFPEPDYIILSSGIFGIVLSLIIYASYERKINLLNDRKRKSFFLS